MDEFWGFPPPPRFSYSRRHLTSESLSIVCSECKTAGGYHSTACSMHDPSDETPEYLMPVRDTCGGVVSFIQQFELFCQTREGQFAQYEAERGR